MKRNIALAVLATIALVGISYGDPITTTFSAGDMGDLAHEDVYSWNIVTSLPSGYVYTGATISFKNIADWTTETNQLNVNLLPDPVNLGTPITAGVTSCQDFSAPTNYWASQPGINLTTYVNLPTTAQNLSYSFNTTQLAALNTYDADGKFGIGIDPDCHFYNDGITLTLTASKASVPEPGMISMLGISILGMGLFARRKRNK